MTQRPSWQSHHHAAAQERVNRQIASGPHDPTRPVLPLLGQLTLQTVSQVNSWRSMTAAEQADVVATQKAMAQAPKRARR